MSWSDQIWKDKVCLGLPCAAGGEVHGLSQVGIATSGTLGGKLEGLYCFGGFQLLHRSVLTKKSTSLGD